MKDIKKKIAKVLDTSAMDNTRLETGKDIGRALISTQDGLIDALLYVQNVRENLEDEINRFIDSKKLQSWISLQRNNVSFSVHRLVKLICFQTWMKCFNVSY